MDDLNGTHVEAPDAGAQADPAECEDCATSGERVLAVLAGLFGALVIIMAVDIFTNGRVTGFVAEQRAARGRD